MIITFSTLKPQTLACNNIQKIRMLWKSSIFIPTHLKKEKLMLRKSIKIEWNTSSFYFLQFYWLQVNNENGRFTRNRFTPWLSMKLAHRETSISIMEDHFLTHLNLGFYHLWVKLLKLQNEDIKYFTLSIWVVIIIILYFFPPSSLFYCSLFTLVQF